MTPVGLLGDAELAEGMEILRAIEAAFGRGADDSDLRALSGDYYRRIPTAIGRSRQQLEAALFLDARRDATRVRAALDTLDTARGLIAAQAGQSTNGGAAVAGQYPVTLEPVTAKEQAALEAFMRRDPCSGHSPDVQRSPVRNAFRVTREAELRAFEASVARVGGQVLDVCHGTNGHCVAGIASRGLLPSQQAKAAGGAWSGNNYGDGIYGAPQPCKSLEYADGARGERHMFLAYFVLGRVHEHQGYSDRTFKRRAGCDSVWAKRDARGYGLIHDEVVVPTADRAALGYVFTI